MNRIIELLTDAISRRAYEIWEEEGKPEGRAEQNWLEAEQEMVIVIEDEYLIVTSESPEPLVMKMG